MKQNAPSSETLIKRELLDALKELKQDLRLDIKASETRMMIKMDEMELRIDDKLTALRSEFFTKFDTWAKELETSREDREITSKQLNDHERRITKLERIKN